MTFSYLVSDKLIRINYHTYRFVVYLSYYNLQKNLIPKKYYIYNTIAYVIFEKKRKKKYQKIYNC